MKNIITVLFTIFTSIAIEAATMKVQGPCSAEPLVAEEFPINHEETVGAFTVRVFDLLNISYLGNDQGMNSIFETPVGLEAMEVISDNEMMAYGWCYSVNGVQPGIYANEVKLQPSDEVLWWFGYAHYLNGEWLSMCSPSYERQADFLCNN